jgi:hypothetical protein
LKPILLLVFLFLQLLNHCNVKQSTAIVELSPETCEETVMPIKKAVIANISKKISKNQHKADYESLLSDGVLKITFAIGYTEEYATIAQKGNVSLHNYSLDVLHKWIAKKGWNRITSTGANPEIYTGSSAFRVNGEIGFWEKNTQIELKILLPRAESAKIFEEELLSTEIMVYMGHSRFGIGPDFDHIKSAEGNFVIGLNAPEHKNGLCQIASEYAQLNVASPKINSLKELTNSQKTSEIQYRICFFNACNSFRYVDEWRSSVTPTFLRKVNTDLFCTRGVVNLGTVAYTSTLFIDEILEGKSMETMPSHIFDADKKARAECGLYIPEEVSGFKQNYFWDGIADNPLAKNVL